MRNNRPIESEHIREALEAIRYILEMKDLSAGIFLCDQDEMAWAYKLPASWNAFIEDRETDLGIRIRAKSAELGEDRAKELTTNAVHILAAMVNLGNQTRIWGKDIITLTERNSKAKIHLEPYHIPRLIGEGQRRKR